MDFDWTNYLKLSKSLQKLTLSDSISDMGISEACQRTAVSRAYYAIYHIALNFAERSLGYKRFINKEAGRNHTKLAECYKDKGIIDSDSDYKELGRILINTFYNRIKCDYDNEVKNTKSQMDNAILNAEDALRIIERKLFNK